MTSLKKFEYHLGLLCLDLRQARARGVTLNVHT